MLFSIVLMLACQVPATTDARTCALHTPTLVPSSAMPGEQIVVTTQPLTEAWDTAVTVGSARAELVAIDRSTCDDCDDCRDTGGCSTCDECEECDTPCDTCVQTLTFVVPDLGAGEWPVEIVNRHGRSERVALTVVAAPAP
jgi:hypothetical protein